MNATEFRLRVTDSPAKFNGIGEIGFIGRRTDPAEKRKPGEQVV
jgi:hypothetical protein